MIGAIHQARLMVEDRREKRYSAVHLIGYSLGALTAAHMGHQVYKIGQDQYFKSVTLLNSPVGYSTEVKFLDQGKPKKEKNLSAKTRQTPEPVSKCLER